MNMTISKREGDFERLQKMIADCIEVATYRKAAMQNVAPLEIYPEDARYLAGLLQELRQYRETA